MTTASQIQRRFFFKGFALLTLFCAFSLSALQLRAETDSARVVKYSQNDIVPVRAKVRFSTLIVLPASEDILDFTTGDKDFWVINGVHNLCFIHPAQAGIRTDLNLITASGHVYSFLLTEVSNEPNVQPDLKIFIEPKDQSSVGGQDFFQGYVPASEVDAYKKEIQTIREQADAQVQTAETQASQKIEKFRYEYPAKLRFDYAINKKASGQPFLISAIYHDDAFTYIQCAAREKPTLYEMKDGKPNLINFQFENGVYIIPKVVDSGYLAIGKKKLTFTRQR
ncbi:MAG TPA: TrbG/VirB9 family P-type conjugative transfer protein [Candidatus Acidoferrales bacterium]|nr:TrbG/VirB9 family P-type conjugative transfer protein [Candidatus Acidoferrales bacterium]